MTIEKAVPNLTSGRLLAHNTMWNLIGQIIPLVVGMVTIPLLVRGLGVDRFGLLSLVWIIIGYFNLFDLGLGRALTKLVADRLGNNDYQSIPSLVWSALFLMLMLSGAGGLIVLVTSPWLVHSALKYRQRYKLRRCILFTCSLHPCPSLSSLPAYEVFWRHSSDFAFLQ